MDNIQSISFKGYKSFTDEIFISIEDIGNVNVIIGKNNSGKSSVVDIIQFINSLGAEKDATINTNQIDVCFRLDEPTIRSGFSESRSGGGIPGNHYIYGKKFIGHMMRITVPNTRRSNWRASEDGNDFIISGAKVNWDRCAVYVGKELANNTFRRLSAERNIVPEKVARDLKLAADGSGATNIISGYMNLKNMDEGVIERELLEALNKIMFPDAEFQRIQTQVIEIDHVHHKDIWEIFLQEKNAGRFPLSQSGSGLKTIILVLLNLLVIPRLKDYRKKKIIFAFEELENNLHPALQRRMFDYICDYAQKKDAYIFLTTHSHVAINAFFGRQRTQIYHVIKDNNKSTIHSISSHLDKMEILDDLDVKASDLLQSNGIIWVEGPTDRIYVKKWLEIFGGEKLREGKHYQFLYYGGKILSHFSSDMDSHDKYINILTTNRNAAIIMDSDRKTSKGRINKTKTRVKNEFDKNKMFCWITKGKEIENYLSIEIISYVFKKSAKKACNPYESLMDYIEEHFGKQNINKVELASKVIEHMDKDSADILDVKLQIMKLIKEIKGWNKGMV